MAGRAVRVGMLGRLVRRRWLLVTAGLCLPGALVVGVTVPAFAVGAPTLAAVSTTEGEVSEDPPVPAATSTVASSAAASEEAAAEPPAASGDAESPSADDAAAVR